MISRMIRRVFVEDKNSHSSTALLNDLKGNLNIAIPSVRILQRYDVEGIDDSQYEAVKISFFAKLPSKIFTRSLSRQTKATPYLPLNISPDSSTSAPIPLNSAFKLWRAPDRS